MTSPQARSTVIRYDQRPHPIVVSVPADLVAFTAALLEQLNDLAGEAGFLIIPDSVAAVAIAGAVQNLDDE